MRTIFTATKPLLTKQPTFSFDPDADRENMLRAQGEFSADAEIRWERRYRERRQWKETAGNTA